MSESTSESVTVPQPSFVFQPPSGGDVDLKSCDGVIFRAHSVLLGIASTVFADMFAGATKSDTIELAEDAEPGSPMLAFIYPITPPPIHTVDLLEKFMAMSHKYDIDKMINFVDQIIQLQNEVVLSDPLRVFRASAQYHFPAAQALAARSLRSHHCDMTSVEGILKLSKFFPNSSHVVGLVGAQAVRAKVLAGALLEKPLEHSIYPKCENIKDSHWGSYSYSKNYMICSNCWSKNRAYCDAHKHYKPGWISAWAIRIFNILLKKPVHQSDGYFSISCLSEIQSSGLETCSTCISHTQSQQSSFDQWAKEVKAALEKELEVLNSLYSL